MKHSGFLATCWLLAGLVLAAGLAAAVDEKRPESIGEGAGLSDERTVAGTGDVPERNDFDVDWWSVDGGGGSSSAGDYRIDGTAGQPDTAVMEGGDFAVAGGYWQILRDPDLLFADGFESGDTTMWSMTVGP